MNEKLFLGNINKNIMISTSGRVHRETRTTFKNNEKINKSDKGKKNSSKVECFEKI